MNEPQTRTLTHYESSLIGYATFNNSIVYVTPSSINIINAHSIKQTAPINGSSVVNFALSSRNQVAILYQQRYIEVRRTDRLKEVLKRIEGVNISQAQDYPLLKILNQELYLVYPTAVEIISLKDGSRSKYTDLISEPEYHKIYDLLLLNLIESLSIGVLQLKNRLIIAIIPCTITQLHIQGLTHVLCLHPNPTVMHPKTTYLAVLSEDILIKIFDLTTLKQIAEIELPGIEGFIQIESDPQSEYILVHYLQRETCAPLHNFIYKINSAFFYNEKRSELTCQQFILYHFQIKNHEYLSPLTFNFKGSFHSYSLYYFKDQKLNLVTTNMPNNERQSEEEMQSITDFDFWKENPEWKDIINTYMQIEDQGAVNNKKMIYSEEERQLEEYYEITKDFDLIVGQFTAILAEKSKKCKLNQQEVEEQWEIYLENVARERNFMKQTMNLFKIDYKIVNEPHQEKNLIGIELQTCMKDIEGREGRVDAKIRQKKQQLEQEQLRKERPKLTQADIQKEQEQYNKFVTEYLAEIQKKQAIEVLKAKQKDKVPQSNEDLNPTLKLELPKLNEEQKKMIQHKSLDLSRMSSLSSHKEEHEHSSAREQFLLILNQIQVEVSPLQQHLQTLIDKIDNFQHSSLQKIKQNENRLKEQMTIDLQSEVKKNCKGMFSKLSSQIKENMNEAMQKLYKIQQKSMKQSEQIIQKFKQYAKMQVRHRIQVYHRSRRQLQLKAHNIAKGQTELKEQTKQTQ